MRYPPDHKEKSRARILEAAGRVFRRQGYHASGVDQVMEEAGLTSGGFYAHFESKQALLAEVLEHTAAGMGARRDAGLERLSGREWVVAFLSRYLGGEHRRNAEEGCPLVALVCEVSRAEGPVKERFEAIVRDLGGRLEANARGGWSGPSEERALAALALCVGGLGLARSVRDEAFAERILEACRSQAMAILCGVDEAPLGVGPRGGESHSTGGRNP